MTAYDQHTAAVKVGLAITATKRVMRALQRQCLPDLIEGWADLLRLVDVHPVPLTYTSLPDVTWGIVTENIWKALDTASDRDEQAWWFVADARLRLYVQQQINWELECGNDDLAAKYRAFVEGK